MGADGSGGAGGDGVLQRRAAQTRSNGWEAKMKTMETEESEPMTIRWQILGGDCHTSGSGRRYVSSGSPSDQDRAELVASRSWEQWSRSITDADTEEV
jgi:hypothetical protein